MDNTNTSTKTNAHNSPASSDHEIFERLKPLAVEYASRCGYDRKTTRQLLAHSSEAQHLINVIPDTAGLMKVFGEVVRSVCEPTIGVSADRVQAKKIEWLWQDRIPLGKLTVLEGDPDGGKSCLTIDIASRVSIGSEFPNGAPCTTGNVVLFGAEDDPNDTIVPRILAAGGDLKRIHLVSAVQNEGDKILDLTADAKLIEETIKRHRAVLAVIDPLSAFLSGKVDSHRDQDIRRVLAKLAKIAEHQHCSIILVRHLNKGGGPDQKAMYRGGGSIGIIGAARQALLATYHPKDKNPDPKARQRLLVPIKSNLSKVATALSYRIVSAQVNLAGADYPEQLLEVPRIQWGSEVVITADEALAPAPRPPKRTEAELFLIEILRDGARPSANVEREAAKRKIAIRTLDRARKEMAVFCYRKGFGKDGDWYMELPPVDEEEEVRIQDKAVRDSISWRS